MAPGDSAVNRSEFCIAAWSLGETPSLVTFDSLAMLEKWSLEMNVLVRWQGIVEMVLLLGSGIVLVGMGEREYAGYCFVAASARMGTHRLREGDDK